MNIDAINNGGLRMIQDQQGFSDANLFGLNSIDAHQIGSPVLSISHFIRCALTGDKPIVTIEDAVSSVKIIAALEQSAHLRKPVDII
jgi:predicted dehydrogenase